MPKETLRNAIEGVREDLVKQVYHLATITSEIAHTENFSPIEVAAALHVIAELAETGNKIYSQELPIPKDIKVEAASKKIKQVSLEKSVPNNKDGQLPKTFEELLEIRIGNELIRKDKEEITKEELLGLLGKNGKRRKYIQHLQAIKDLAPDKQTFGKNEAVKTIKSVLMSHNDAKGLPQETFTKTALMQNFRVNAARINVWSEEVNYDWKENPAVTRDTALAIKGLFALDKLLGLAKPR